MGTVNLEKLASVFANQAQVASSQKRLTRFFSKFEIDFDEIARAIVGLSQIPQPWTLSLGRTNLVLFVMGLIFCGARSLIFRCDALSLIRFYNFCPWTEIQK